MTELSAGRSRIAWLDAARGIGIVLVILGHVERGLVSAHIARSPAWQTFDTALYTFHMPLFMLLVGMNVPGSLRRGTGRFLAEKLQTVAWPYVLWSLIQGSILVLLSQFANNGATWSDVAQIGWKPMSQFWFLYALMAYLLVVAVVGLRPWVLGGGALVAMVASTRLGTDGIALRLCFFAIFFVAGILLSRPLKELRPRRPLLVAVLLAGAWAACLPLVLPLGGIADLALGALPCAFLGSAAVILAAVALRGRLLAVLARLGAISMTIYVLHILVASATRIAMVRLHVAAPALVYLIVGTGAGILVPAAAHLVFDRLQLLPVLGLGRRPRGHGEVVAERLTGDLARPAG